MTARRFFWLPLLALAGCGVRLVDPCAGVHGTCLAVQVDSSSSVSAVDTLVVQATGVGLAVAKTVPNQGRLKLPVAVGVIFDSLPSSPLAVALEVDGTTDGRASSGSATVTLTSGQHQTVHVSLSSVSPGDGGTADGPPADLSVGDLAGLDLSGLDLTQPVAPPDLLGVDLPAIPPDPTTCAEAVATPSYLGCDFWPTVTFNGVWSVFDFAVVVSNPGTQTATVTITGGGLVATKTVQAPPGQLIEIGLPWVVALKGPDSDSMGSPPTVVHSTVAKNGAYHLTSDFPVIAYQFNALEYKGAAAGTSLNGTAWSSCPGTSSGTGCFSFTNDASLLLPTSTLTGEYSVAGVRGDTATGVSTMQIGGPFVTITGTADGTHVTVKLAASGQTLAAEDGGVAATAGSGTVVFTLNAGDVVELQSADNGNGSDYTGTQVRADHPVQVISGMSCATNPDNYNPMTASYSCDHVEETQLPYEAWGRAYVVTSPTGPNGNTPPHTVRIYGGSSAATLTYSPSVSAAPTTIAAGTVASFDTSTSFYVTGDHEFAVSTLQKSGEIVDPANLGTAKGDPSLSYFTPVEQFRGRYLFLAPNDYDVNYADVAVPLGTQLVLDNVAVAQSPTVIGGGFGLLRLLIGSGATGAHQLVGDRPFGMQVIGYGEYTSYQYPAGLSVGAISPSPSP